MGRTGRRETSVKNYHYPLRNFPEELTSQVWALICGVFYDAVGVSDNKSVPLTGLVVAQRVGRGIALLFHDHGTGRG